MTAFFIFQAGFGILQRSLKAAPVPDWRAVAAGVAFARRPRRAIPFNGRRQGQGAFRYNPPL